LAYQAQYETVAMFLNGSSWQLVGEFVEVETGTRKGDHRPELDKALARCRVMDATLIVANVSRLTRNPDFMSWLVQAGVAGGFRDAPQPLAANGSVNMHRAAGWRKAMPRSIFTGCSARCK